jgi:superfamily II DNA or RNA helicase
MSALVAFRSDPRLVPWYNRWLSEEAGSKLDRSRAFTLRQYQNDCVDAVYREWESGRRSTQVVMATGTGKTVCFAEVARRCKGKVLVVVHREVLLQQTVEKLLQHTGDHVGIERASTRALGEKFVVCTVQTASRRLSRVGLRREFDAVIIDECFVRGTLVDGSPIEDLVAGDVLANGHGNVLRAGCRLAPDKLVTINGCTSTTDHPYLTPHGWKKAGDLKPGELFCVRQSDAEVPKSESLEGYLLPRVPVEALVRDYGFHQQASRFCKDDRAQSDAFAEGAGEGCRHSPEERAHAEAARRQRPWAYVAGIPACCCSWVGYERHRAYGTEEARGVADSLQDRRGACGTEGGCGGGWRQPQAAVEARAGRAERGVLAWARVDSVEVHERGGVGRYDEVCPDGLVYNVTTESGCFEVGSGALVHNSHHADTDHRYRLITDWFEKARVVCFTATPVFAEKLLVPESLAYYMDIKRAPEEGWLVPLVGDRVEVEDFNLRDLRAWSHEFDEGEVPEFLVNKVAPIRDVLMDRYRDRRGILFTNSVREAYLLNEAINGIKSGTSVMVNATTPADQRRELIKRLWKGRSRFFCNVGIAVEGFDWPQADLVLVGAETTWHAYVQKVGRVTRPAAGVVDGLSSASERRKAIAQSAKPNGLVLEVFRQGTTPDKLVQQGVSLEQAYEDGMRQIAEVMEISYRVEEKTERNAEQDEVRYQLQQARRPVVLIDSETVYNVSRFGVVDRFTEQLSGRERTPGSANRINVPPEKMAEEEIVPKLPRLQLPRAIPGWENSPPTERQARALERLGVDVPRHATKQWASWALDVMTNRKWSIEIKHEQLKRIPVAPRRTR